MNQLEQLKKMTKVVADTSDVQVMRQYAPLDATTNPSLILKAVRKVEYQPLLDRVLKTCTHKSLDQIMDAILIAFGLEILKIVPGRVSTEVDAHLSFDVAGTVDKARSLISLYEAQGVVRERVLIKIASTWEGICAARILEKEGIHCNMTLLFTLSQAVACAEAEVQLISPFVGRIYDWYKKTTGQEYSGDQDPGVQSVKEIYAYYKNQGYATEVMGASFRNIGQITELAGCDLLTISPDLLQKLEHETAPLIRKLSVDSVRTYSIHSVKMNEQSFRMMLNESAMGTEKLAEGIRLFCADVLKLRTMIAARIENGV